MRHESIETLARERYLTPNTVSALAYLRAHGRSRVEDIAVGIHRSERATTRALGALRGNRLAEQVSAIEWQERVTNDEGLRHVSTGAAYGCRDCGLEEVNADDDPDYRALQAVEDPHFSHGGCDTCNTRCGGDRHPAHGVTEDGTIVHLDVCNECLYDINGLEFTSDPLEGPDTE